MRALKKFLTTFSIFFLLAVVGYMVVIYYSFIFSKDVDGQIFQVERVTAPTVVMGSAVVGSPAAMHSYAVAIRDVEGKIYTGSSEDRQWAVARRGMCATVRFYPYPPWDLQNAGTYHNARLSQLRECPANMPPLSPGTTVPPGPSESGSDMNAPSGNHP